MIADLDLQFASREDLLAYLGDDSAGEVATEALVVAVDSPIVVTLPEHLRARVEYCVGPEFGETRPMVIAAAARAAGMWSEFADVRFEYVERETCATRGVDAHLVIIGECDQQDRAKIAVGMLPWRNGRRGQAITINTCTIDYEAFASSEDPMTRVLLHELGHVLGFVHAWNARDYEGECACSANTRFLGLGPYDAASIMNYPMCGASWSFLEPPALSEGDREHVTSIYCAPGLGPPPCRQ